MLVYVPGSAVLAKLSGTEVSKPRDTQGACQVAVSWLQSLCDHCVHVRLSGSVRDGFWVSPDSVPRVASCPPEFCSNKPPVSFPTLMKSWLVLDTLHHFLEPWPHEKELIHIVCWTSFSWFALFLSLLLLKRIFLHFCAVFLKYTTSFFLLLTGEPLLFLNF